MGHMLNQTEMDILTRWHRMCGDTALWVPGTDHAGIATQTMVERQLAEEGTDRKALGREAFIARVWKWKCQYGSAITEQMKRLGASVDWSREYFTMDDRLSIAVKEAFVRLWEQGLIYRGAYIVNWDPQLQTAVSDLEVENEERAGHLYSIRYPLADGTGSIVVATTRPETMLGDTAVAVNPNDERYQEFIGKLVTLPLSAAAGHPDREIPILGDGWANPEFGTGAVKVTPAHDPNDFAIGQRHSLPQLNIFDETAHISLAGSPYFGLDRFAARKRIIADLESAGLLVAVKDHTLTLPISQRTGVVIEPRLSMQWFLAVNKPFGGSKGETRPSIAETSIAAVRDGHIRFTPDNYVKIYNQWMTNIHDWCISRQLWWGHRIPAWHCGKCGAITVSRTTPDACGTCASTDITQSTDVLDTWFSSGLLPFTAFGWPGEQGTEVLRKTAEGEGKYIRQVGGTGNYAHVRLRVSPNEAGKGFIFSNETDSGTLPVRFVEPIREGIREAMRGGVVEGHPLVDVKVSVIGGSYHEVDSNEMAFRIAASTAFKEAARKAAPIAFDPSSNLEPAHLKAHGNLLTLDPTSNLEPRTSNLTPDLATFYPTSLLLTGFDILFFWVARMIMLSTHFMLDMPMPDGSPRPLAEAVPFKNVYIHGLIRDANREKMSKMKGNVIDPIEIITKYGTDAVRFTLASQASPGTDIAFNEARTEGYRAFANKIWNAARFLFMNLDRAKEAGYSVTMRPPAPVGELPDHTPLETRWIFARLSIVSAEVARALNDYRFDEAASAVYQFFWGEFCDWYLELVKLRLNFDIPVNDDTAITLASLTSTFEAALRLLSPFMPFLTEEIWHALYAGAPPAKSIALTRYPQASDFPSSALTLAAMETMQELITTVRALRKDLNVPEKEATRIHLHAGARVLALAGAHSDMLGRLARVSAVEIVDDPLSGAHARSTPSFDVAVVYERQIDVAAERERLSKDLAKLEKILTANDARLADPKFTDKAPVHIVEGLRKQTEETRILRDKTKAALDVLPSA
jgi:valyl-tRNA synthetase